MSRSLLWTTAVFVVFAFATLIIFFWVREGSLEGAGAEMDSLLGRTGDKVAETTDQVVDGTSGVIDRATDGDDRT
jgi:hypothetical protein